MRRAHSRLLAPVLTALALAGCASMDLDARALEPHLYMARDGGADGAVEAVTDFEARTRASWALWGLIDLKEPELGEVLEREIDQAGGTAATRVELVTQTTFMDGFLGLITFGIYTRRTTLVRGTVVR